MLYGCVTGLRVAPQLKQIELRCALVALHCIISSTWPNEYSCACPCVCVCCILVWLTDWLKCCCVSAGVWGSPQSGAKGLRSRLDHCHQSAGGNPHLFAVSCATLEGKHMNTDWDFSSYSIRRKTHKTACFSSNIFAEATIANKRSLSQTCESQPEALCLTLVWRQHSIQLYRDSWRQGKRWG